MCVGALENGNPRVDVLGAALFPILTSRKFITSAPMCALWRAKTKWYLQRPCLGKLRQSFELSISKARSDSKKRELMYHVGVKSQYNTYHVTASGYGATRGERGNTTSLRSDSILYDRRCDMSRSRGDLPRKSLGGNRESK
jgi:hypothetical protein